MSGNFKYTIEYTNPEIGRGGFSLEQLGARDKHLVPDPAQELHMALSEMAVRQARTTANPYSLTDFDGLSLYVSKGGSKIWHFRYYWLGKQQRMSLGAYPQVSLKDARLKRDEARELVADGINPCEQRKEQKRAARERADYIFASVFRQWYEFRALELKAGRQRTLS